MYVVCILAMGRWHKNAMGSAVLSGGDNWFSGKLARGDFCRIFFRA